MGDQQYAQGNSENFVDVICRIIIYYLACFIEAVGPGARLGVIV